LSLNVSDDCPAAQVSLNQQNDGIVVGRTTTCFIVWPSGRIACLARSSVCLFCLSVCSVRAFVLTRKRKTKYERFPGQV